MYFQYLIDELYLKLTNIASSGSLEKKSNKSLFNTLFGFKYFLVNLNIPEIKSNLRHMQKMDIKE